jgi:hypothetical protein
VVANCVTLDGLEWDITILNNKQQGPYMEQFGTDKQGLQTLYISLFLFYVFFGGTVASFILTLRKDAFNLHPLIRLFGVVVGLQAASTFCYFLHFTHYVYDGVGYRGFYWLGALLSLLSRNVFLFLLLLLSKGWTISVATLAARNSALLVCANVLLDSIILLWEGLVWQPEMTRVPSTCAFFMRLSQLLWIVYFIYFVRNCNQSSKDEIDEFKKRVYYGLGSYFGLWMLSLALIGSLALILSPWVRPIVIATVTELSTAAAYAGFAALIYPPHAKRFFAISGPSVLDSSGFRDQSYGNEGQATFTRTADDEL